MGGNSIEMQSQFSNIHDGTFMEFLPTNELIPIYFFKVLCINTSGGTATTKIGITDLPFIKLHEVNNRNKTPLLIKASDIMNGSSNVN